jgi:hypothetical protein
MGWMIYFAPLFAYFAMRDMSRIERVRSAAAGSLNEWLLDSPPLLMLSELGALAGLWYSGSPWAAGLLPAVLVAIAAVLATVAVRAAFSRRIHLYTLASALVLALAAAKQFAPAIGCGMAVNVLLQGYEVSLWRLDGLSDALTRERTAEDVRGAMRKMFAAMDSVLFLSLGQLVGLVASAGTITHPNVGAGMVSVVASMLALLLAADAPLGPVNVRPLTWPGLARHQMTAARWACRGASRGH